MDDDPLRVLDLVRDRIRAVGRGRDLAGMRSVKLDEASRVGGVKKRLRRSKEGELPSDRPTPTREKPSYLLWGVTMLDSITHRLSVEHALTFGELSNAEVTILELRDGDARRVGGSWSSEKVVKRVAPLGHALGDV